ncbi:hypothetical protein HKCCE2091_07690 [Rhodobacterales bacterium HKCCE2091]|nr:hypothetical protein [Rhodobacterales bacterium HKCCE2091]
MARVIWFALAVAALAVAVLLVLAVPAIRDRREEAAQLRRLAALSGAKEPRRFDPAMTEALPEAARRYFAFVLSPGAPLRPVTRITMRGSLVLGPREAPRAIPFEARQILAPPEGFVWSMKGKLIAGSDAGGPAVSWTRFRLAGLVPVARAGGGDPDHLRSAFGRLVGEAAFWAPAALLPGPGIEWQEAGPDTARVRVTAGSLSQAVDIALGPDDGPVHVRFDRWSNENPDRTYRLQPFGGTLSEFIEVDGVTVPTRVEAGNHFGTEDYAPFFRVTVTDLSFTDLARR